MKRTRTAIELAGALAALAGVVALYWLTVAGGLIATAVLLFGASYVIGEQ